jgi:glycosyltransferase involved in cell wall biosynthesis
VLLPVRDEETNVAACVASLLAQGPVSRIVVVDDGSGDRTREIAARIAAEADRVVVLDAGELPAGWNGKVHALERGLAETDAPWVLSTDADTRHAPSLLARALATAEARGLHSLSIAGFQETLGLGETLLTPAVFALLDGILGDWHRVADGGSEVANGQFFLVRTEALEAIGGFASVRDQALDDVALARRLRGEGFRHAFVRAPDLLRVRMYEGLAGTFRGWRRNLGAIFAGRSRRVAYLSFLLFVPVLLMLWGALAGDWAAVAVTWAAGAAASMLLRRGSGHPSAVGLLYPLDALLLAACLLLGYRDASRGRLASWKGRAVALEPPAASALSAPARSPREPRGPSA